MLWEVGNAETNFEKQGHLLVYSNAIWNDVL